MAVESVGFAKSMALRFFLMTFAVLAPSTIFAVFWVLFGLWRYLPVDLRTPAIIGVFWKLAVVNTIFSTPVWFIIFNRYIVQPLRELGALLVSTGQGDLTVEIQIDRQDEIGLLASQANRLISDLRTLVQKIKYSSKAVSASSQNLAASADELSSSTLEISSSMQQISQGAELQAKKVEETSQAVNNITSAIHEIAPKAKAAAEISEEAAKLAKEGESATSEAIGKINQVQEVTARSAQAVRMLEGRSVEIGRIVDLITNIADQTNLLSLNAAIEAARAGESGRGFAVVADEVRKLADGSAQAAEQIAKLIKEVQSETHSAVQAMEEGTREVSVGAAVMNQAGEVLHKILQAVDETAKTSDEIAAALRNQAECADIVDRAVSDIAAVVEENAASAEETAAATEEQTASMQEINSQSQQMEGMAQNLQKSIEVFKIEGD